MSEMIPFLQDTHGGSVAGASVKTGKLCAFVWPFQHKFLGGVILLLCQFYVAIPVVNTTC